VVCEAAIFLCLRRKDKGLNYEQAIVQGLSIRKAAASCGIAKNTSFKWRHRFLHTPAIQQPTQMSGIAEADETFFLESFKGQRHLSRIARKRGGKAAKRGTSAEQIPVLVVRTVMVKPPTLFYKVLVWSRLSPYSNPC
jgi:transposase-like protein